MHDSGHRIRPASVGMPPSEGRGDGLSLIEARDGPHRAPQARVSCYMRLRQATCLLTLLVLLGPRPIPGQEGEPQTPPASDSPVEANQAPTPSVGHESVTKRFVLDIWTDQKAIWSSPFRMNRRQLLTIALPVAAITAGLIATDEKTASWLPNTPAQIDWSNGVSTAGSIYTLGGVVGGSLTVGKVKDNPTILRMGGNSAEALINAVIVSSAMKLAAGRERPDQNDGEGRFWKGGSSFPSGHAMDSFAVAAAIARSRGCPRWLAITSYAAAAAVSISRYTAHRHFPSDVFVGSAFGILIGQYVADRPRP
jgi:membrane-associated phospholipid phosphatase